MILNFKKLDKYERTTLCISNGGLNTKNEQYE